MATNYLIPIIGTEQYGNGGEGKRRDRRTEIGRDRFVIESNEFNRIYHVSESFEMIESSRLCKKVKRYIFAGI